MSANLPTKEQLTGNVTQGQFKNGMNQLIDYLNGVAVNNNSETIVITSSQLVIVPAWASKAILTGVAPGGGGGACTGCGGGSGQSAYRRVFNVNPGETIQVNIGTPGSGNRTSNLSGTSSLASYTNLNGSDAGNVSFGNYMTLIGGKGAISNPSAVNSMGGIGENQGAMHAINMMAAVGGGFNFFWNGGDGAGSPYGAGGIGGWWNFAEGKTNGSNGVGFGSGGGGGGLKQTTSPVWTWTSGGDGAPGILTIEWE